MDDGNKRLSVQFFKKPLINPAKTAAEGREIYDDVIWIKKMIPGDALNIIERPIYEQDKMEFPLHWAHFQNQHGSDEMLSGTPLSEWSLISRSQAEELKGLKFYTIEQIAEASDLALQRMGMSAGMSPYTFRDKAKAFLNKSSSDAEALKRDESLKALEAENERLRAENKAEMDKLKAQLDMLMYAQKSRGRKPKVVEIAE
jgi:hypothetical protein